MTPATEKPLDQDQWLYLWDRRASIRVRALMSRFYYQERQRIFETREGVVRAISILGGSLAFTKLFGADAKWLNLDVQQWCAAIITATGAGSLVFGFGTKARDSAKRSAEWAMLERDIEMTGERDFTEADINKWAGRCNEIEASAPSLHPVLQEKCYLRACASLGNKPIGESSLWRWRMYCPPFVIH
jgi:hypothetical protein